MSDHEETIPMRECSACYRRDFQDTMTYCERDDVWHHDDCACPGEECEAAAAERWWEQRYEREIG